MTVSDISDRNRRRAVWAVPVVVAGVIALVATMGAASSAGAPKLKAMTAAQLLAAVGGSQQRSFSGVVAETTKLGLPSLPGDSSAASLSWQNFLTGTHQVRVWADGPDKQRAALIGELSEADVVHNGKDVWTYTSTTNTVSHHVLSAADHKRPVGTAPDLTPAAAAQRVLAAITPTTKVSVDTARTVADRSAYTLTLSPRDSRSTVSRVTLAIDAKTFVPLQVQVFGSGSSPAISIGFTEVSFARPAASTFVFHAPAGSKTESNPVTSPPSDRRHGGSGGDAPSAQSARPSVLGSGWTAVLELHDASMLGGRTLQQVTTDAGNGRRLLQTALVNAVFLPDGRVFAGALKPDALERLAASTPR